MHPLQLITGFLSSLITLGLLSANIYFIREWYQHKDISTDDRYAIWCLSAAVASTILILFGKYIFKIILGKPGKDEPNMQRSAETKLLKRPEGHSLFLEFYGPKEAQPIIFIHGWNSNSTQWYYLKKHFSKSYRLILLDLPGCGGSSKKPNQEYSPEAFAKDLNEVILSAGGKKPIVVGHSIGGMTILNFCKLYINELSSKVTGLVLIQTTYTNPVKTSIMSSLLTSLQKPLLQPMCRLMIGVAPLVQIMNWLKYMNGSMHLSNHLTGFGQTETKGQLNLTTYLSTVSPVDVVARGMLGMFKYDAASTLSNIKVPVLIVAGDKDILCKPEASQYMQGHIPFAKLVVLKPSGHMGPLERNDQVILAVEEFVKETTKATVIQTSQVKV